MNKTIYIYTIYHQGSKSEARGTNLKWTNDNYQVYFDKKLVCIIPLDSVVHISSSTFQGS